MKKLIPLFVLMFGCQPEEIKDDVIHPKKSDVKLVGEEHNSSGLFKLRGFFELDRLLQNRVTHNSLFVENTMGEDLSRLSGVFEQQGNQTVFVNGVPNATNALLWELAASQVGQSLEKLCDNSSGNLEVIWKKDFLLLLSSMCEWPNHSVRNEVYLREVWRTFMSYDAPDSEFQIWKDFMMSDEIAKLPPAVTLSLLIKSMILNPYFLLKR